MLINAQSQYWSRVSHVGLSMGVAEGSHCCSYNPFNRSCQYFLCNNWVYQGGLTAICFIISKHESSVSKSTKYIIKGSLSCILETEIQELRQKGLGISKDEPLSQTTDLSASTALPQQDRTHEDRDDGSQFNVTIRMDHALIY